MACRLLKLFSGCHDYRLRAVVPVVSPMIWSFPVGSIRVRVDAGWVLVVGLLTWSLAAGYFPHVLPARSTVAYWAGGLVAVGLLGASLVVHELAHAVVARLFGMHLAAVRFHVFGGVADMDREAPHPGADAAVAVAGPVTSFAIAGGALAARHATGDVDWAAAQLGSIGLVNLAIGLFNLMPAFPLDGGRVLRALLWWWSDDADGSTTVASRVGVAFAVVLVALGLVRLYYRDTVGGIWFALLGGLLFHAGRWSPEVMRVRRRLDAERPLDRVA